jgi:hypothetical protein
MSASLLFALNVIKQYSRYLRSFRVLITRDFDTKARVVTHEDQNIDDWCVGGCETHSGHRGDRKHVTYTQPT